MEDSYMANEVERWFLSNGYPTIGMNALSIHSKYIDYCYINSSDRLVIVKKVEDQCNRVTYTIGEDADETLLKEKKGKKILLDNAHLVIEQISWVIPSKDRSIIPIHVDTYEKHSSGECFSVVRQRFASPEETQAFCPPVYYGKEIINHAEWSEYKIWLKCIAK